MRARFWNSAEILVLVLSEAVLVIENDGRNLVVSSASTVATTEQENDLQFQIAQPLVGRTAAPKDRS